MITVRSAGRKEIQRGVADPCACYRGLLYKVFQCGQSGSKSQPVKCCGSAIIFLFASKGGSSKASFSAWHRYILELLKSAMFCLTLGGTVSCFHNQICLVYPLIPVNYTSMWDTASAHKAGVSQILHNWVCHVEKPGIPHVGPVVPLDPGWQRITECPPLSQENTQTHPLREKGGPQICSQGSLTHTAHRNSNTPKH